jgi:hypothetical protein
MSPADDLRVDWFRLITDLNRAGHSTRRFADNLGIPRTTIEGWKAGAEPKHADGERLIALWCERMGKGREHLPRISEFDFRR